MKWNSQDLSDRKIYFDYLRVFAAFAMMILHISAQKWYKTNVNCFEWQVFNFFDSTVRWSVPVFVMISGSLFLNRDIPLKRIYTKYILRIVIAFIAWSAIYILFLHDTLINQIFTLIQGHYHMWFILMIIGIYMCIPFIKPIVETESRTKYYLLLSLVFAFILPELFTLTEDFGNETVTKISNAVRGDVSNMNMNTVLGYTGYFVLGYYLDKKELNRGWRIVIYILGILGFTFTIFMDLIVALKTQAPCSHYYGYFNVNVLLEAVAVFTLFKYRRYGNVKVNIAIQKMSKYSFGAYLVHALIIEQLNKRLGLNTLSFNPILSVLTIGVIVFVVSFAISAILNGIPAIRKYLV